MGRGTLIDMLDEMKAEQALIWHLTCNHYPPLPAWFADTAKEAIEACAGNLPEALITLPAGVTWKGQYSAPAGEIADWMHLWPFVEMRQNADWQEEEV